MSGIGSIIRMMTWPERIVVDPEILAGKPVIRGSRIAAELILEQLAAGQLDNDILVNYPGLTKADILACLAYASYLAPRVPSLSNPCLNENSVGRIAQLEGSRSAGSRRSGWPVSLDA